MVVRMATAWILIATLMLCPFGCLGEAVAALTATEVGRGHGVTDTCCAPSRSPTGDHDPGDRERGEQGGDCLCHGAIMADHSSASELLPVPVFWVLQTLPTSTACALSTVDAPVEKHACHFPNVNSGREVRALVESFLL
jgi:hypothetical protein